MRQWVAACMARGSTGTAELLGALVNGSAEAREEFVQRLADVPGGVLWLLPALATLSSHDVLAPHTAWLATCIDAVVNSIKTYAGDA